MRQAFIASSLTLISLSVSLQRSYSRPCSLDLNFNPALNPGAAVYVVALQTNGQILIGGSFTSVGNVGVTNVARLNSDRTLDPGFNPRNAVDRGYVTALAVQPDGKVVIGGAFYSSSGIAQANITRLNPNGTVDTVFDQNVFVDGPVNALVLQSDGKVLVGGGFLTVDFERRVSIGRLNTDGTLDITFDACVAATAGAGATALALQSDGTIFASGRFTFSTGVSRDGIARLKSCGDVDLNYDPQPGINPDATVFALALRTNGTVCLGGDFQTFQLAPRRGIVQLTANGAVDEAFDPGAGITEGGTVYAIAIQPDGKAIIAGYFSGYNGKTKLSLARVNLDGSLDTICDAGLGPNNSVSSLAIQSGGRTLVAGRFDSFNGESRNGLAQLSGDPIPARLGIPNRLVDGRWKLLLYGQDQAHYAIEGSSNLVSWISLTNVTATSSTMEFIDSDAGFYLQRFYRAISLP